MKERGPVRCDLGWPGAGRSFNIVQTSSWMHLAQRVGRQRRQRLTGWRALCSAALRRPMIPELPATMVGGDGDGLGQGRGMRTHRGATLSGFYCSSSSMQTDFNARRLERSCTVTRLGLSLQFFVSLPCHASLLP